MIFFYVLTLVPVVILSLAIYRFWVCIRRMGFVDEVFRRAPDMLPLDCVSVALAAFVVYYAAMGWWGVWLPMFNHGPLPGWQNMFMALVSSVACIGIAWINSGRRFEQPSWGGMRESAIRTLAALRIIDAAELAYGLEMLKKHDAINRGQK